MENVSRMAGTSLKSGGAEILVKLYFNEMSCRRIYQDLHLSDSNAIIRLKELQNDNLVDKLGSGKRVFYYLTTSGREFVEKLDLVRRLNNSKSQ